MLVILSPVVMVAVAALVSSAPAGAAARIAESGLYICEDGSSVRFDRRGYGPVLLRDGLEIHLRQRFVFSGFRYSSRFGGHSLDVRGHGRSGDKRLKLSEAGKRDLACEAAPKGSVPGIVTGQVVGAEDVSVPSGAVLAIALRSSAPTDAGVPLLAERRILPRRSDQPWAFLMRYPARGAGGQSKAVLSARLTRPDGQLIAVSDAPTPLPVSRDGRNAPAEIKLRAAPAPPSK